MKPERDITARTRQLMQRARELGDRDFDRAERLVHVEIPGLPQYDGGSVAQCSVEYAIALLETGGNAGCASQIIDRVLDFQVRDECSLRHGNFYWMSSWKEPTDPNAVYFLVPNLVHVWNRHRSRLTPRVRQRLKESWPLCMHAMQRHRADWTYTNIFVLGILSRFLLAPLLTRSDLDKDARAQWETFLKGIAHFGICEYNSPTYLPVCIYALEQLCTGGPRDLLRQFRGVLEYFYFEFAARYHAPTGFLAGAMSRAYSWDMELGGSFAALLAHREWGTPYKENNTFSVNWLLAHQSMPAEIRRIALHKPLPLEIVADNRNRNIRRTDYLGRNFTIGSQTGDWYGGQQVPLFVTIAGKDGGASLFVKPSMPTAARFFSKQTGPSVRGLFYYDASAVAYELRKSSPAQTPSEILSYRWRLGKRDLIEAVWVNGKRWIGKKTVLRKQLDIVAMLGHTHLHLALAADGEVRFLLDWEQDAIVLAISTCKAGSLRKNLATGIHFLLDLKENLRETYTRSPKPRRRVILDSKEQFLHPHYLSPYTHVLHRSSLAEIGPDDLLPFFRGRGDAPWS